MTVVFITMPLCRMILQSQCISWHPMAVGRQNNRSTAYPRHFLAKKPWPEGHGSLIEDPMDFAGKTNSFGWFLRVSLICRRVIFKKGATPLLRSISVVFYLLLRVWCMMEMTPVLHNDAKGSLHVSLQTGILHAGLDLWQVRQDVGRAVVR